HRLHAWARAGATAAAAAADEALRHRAIRRRPAGEHGNLREGRQGHLGNAEASGEPQFLDLGHPREQPVRPRRQACAPHRYAPTHWNRRSAARHRRQLVQFSRHADEVHRVLSQQTALRVRSFSRGEARDRRPSARAAAQGARHIGPAAVHGFLSRDQRRARRSFRSVGPALSPVADGGAGGPGKRRRARAQRGVAPAAERAAAGGRGQEMSAVTRERRRGSVRYDPGRVRSRRPPATEAPHVLHVRADDGVMLRLTRYRGGRKGPVILSHCVGVSSRMYSIDTIEPNLLEHLSAAGYDVWLLDYRFSIELEAASRQSSMDDVALRDYPAAVAAVREATGAATIQIVAHGVGASTLTMALLAGLDGVRAVVLSQVSTRLETVLVNRLKARSRMPDVLRLLGGRTLTAYTDVSAGWPERLYDATLASLPAKPEERCS